MRRLLAFILCFFIPVVAFAADSNNSYKVVYDGGSVAGIKSGTTAKLTIDETKIRLDHDKDQLVTIPAGAVTEISYGQDVHRRIGTAIGLAVISLGIGALMMFSKSKKHFIGLTWANGDIKGGFVMQCDKNEYRGVLTALEGITGKKAINSDTISVKN